MPNTRCPMSVATECSTSLGSLASRKHRAIRRTRPRRWSAAPNSRPPASDVSAPPSNSATTDRPSTRPNMLRSALHSVCIGPPLQISASRSRKTTFARLATRCATQFEKCGLSAIDGSTRALATTTQLGNRRLQQDEISARLARVEPDDRMTLRGEGETFRLAVQIVEPPCIKERGGAAARREISEPSNRGGLVT